MPETVSHYRIVRKVGSGGMGEVYLAEDANLRRQVALKMLSQESGEDPQRLQRFLREALAASALNHPNIAVIYEAGQAAEKVPFIAMEYVEGEGLDSRLAKGALVADAVIDLGSQIADALEEAHSKGIIHRDLKPSNVMVTSRGQAKVLDFGLAKFAPGADREDDAETQLKSIEGMVLGTIPYMSPEQALGRAIDHRSDIFSFGTLLYEMATGQRAFRGKSSIETLDRILHEQPPATPELNQEIPGELDRVIRKCMEKDPASRYQSAREIVVDLKNLGRDRSGGRLLPAARPKHRLAIPLLATLVLLALGAAAWLLLRGTIMTGGAPVGSLAVLPFTSNDPRNDFLSDGITDSIIDNLSELPQLKVMSHSSVFRFEGQRIDPQKIGRQLGVQAVVAGNVVQTGDRLTVEAELIDVADGRQLWGERYDRAIAGISSLQGQISGDISEKLRIRLTGAQRKRLTRSYTTDPEAYSLYLKGRYAWNKRTSADLKRAIELFRQASEHDPNYVMAWVGLADCYALLPEVDGTPPAESDARARAAIQKALQIDDSVAEAHATLGMVELNDWNLAAAQSAFRRAIELNPNYATAHQWYALSLESSRRPVKALAEIQKAQQLDPLSPIIDLYRGVAHWVGGNDAEAIRDFKSTIDLDPNFGWAWSYLGRVYAVGGKCNEAMEPLRKGDELTGHNAYARAYVGYALARCGDPGTALAVASQLSAAQASHITVAIVFNGLGQTDKVFEQLEAAYRVHDEQLVYLSWEPEFKNIRSDPRYADLAKKIGIPR